MPDSESILITVGIQGPPGPPGSGGGGSAVYQVTFNNSWLSVGQVLVVNHNLNRYPSSVLLLNNASEVVCPDRIEVANLNTIAVYLTSFAPLQGEWLISVTA